MRTHFALKRRKERRGCNLHGRVRSTHSLFLFRECEYLLRAFVIVFRDYAAKYFSVTNDSLGLRRKVCFETEMLFMEVGSGDASEAWALKKC